MHIEITKITTKGQTTIPVYFRKALGLEPGDEVVFYQDGNSVCIKKSKSIDISFYRSIEKGLAVEWLSSEDCEAFDDL